MELFRGEERQFEPGSEASWIAATQKLKTDVRLEVEAWLNLAASKPQEGEARAENSLDELSTRILNHLLEFQDFKESWMKANRGRRS